MGLPTVAGMLSIDLGTLTAAVEGTGGSTVRQLGDSTQERLDELLIEDPDLCCPITLVLFEDPAVASDGFAYEREAIKQYIRTNGKSPMTRENLKQDLFPALQRKSKACEYRSSRGAELIRFGHEVLGSHPQMARAALQRVQEYLEVLDGKDPALARQASELHRVIGN